MQCVQIRMNLFRMYLILAIKREKFLDALDRFKGRYGIGELSTGSFLLKVLEYTEYI